MEDKQIVELYWDRSEVAIEETDKKYGRYCHYIAYQILENDEDAKEVVNDTYLKTWQNIPPDRPEHLRAYVGMISRQIALNAYEKNHAKKRGNFALAL
ncbi:MAG: RNA polymerase subunit sigma-70, partial [Clostridia bacterium]|nr:RNA polymerase subunit sigma-70 [Clostridia bacterium]